MRKLIIILTFTFGFISAFGHAQNIHIGDDGLYYDSENNLYTGTYIDYYENGTLKSEHAIVNGQSDGITKLYFESGQLNELRTFKAGLKNGSWITYNESGVKTGEANFENNIKSGKWFIWDEQGTLRCDMTYKEGRKVGKWIIYNEQGEEDKVKDFNHQ